MYTAEIFALIAFLSGTIVLWFPNIWLRTIFYVCLLVSILFIWQSSLGNPRYIYFDNVGFPAGRVLSLQINEPISIDLWVLPNNSKPVYIEIPWTLNTAKEIQNAQQGEKESGGSLMVKPLHKSLLSKMGFGLKNKPTGDQSMLQKMLGWFGFGITHGPSEGSSGQASAPNFYSGTPNSLPPKTK